jgi:SP family facilitated glucose transporter-like MFS transporter 1
VPSYDIIIWFQVMFFSTKIFRMAQLDDKSAQYATLGMGAVNVFMTLISMVIVEKAGRKTLLLVGFAGMCFTTILLTICLAYVQVP